MQEEELGLVRRELGEGEGGGQCLATVLLDQVGLRGRRCQSLAPLDQELAAFQGALDVDE